MSPDNEIPDVQPDALRERHVSSLESCIAVRGFNHVGALLFQDGS
jgi:hypothetical protein